jgi:hypothetical protein
MTEIKSSSEEKAMPTGKQLNVQNATVTTATIEVKTLTIGARQVTQGIFKQLIEEPLIAEDGTLNGVPWGHVTWHPDGCTKDNHWHIVWQRGESLRRAHVVKETFFGTFYCPEADALLEHLVSRAAHGLAPVPNVQMRSGGTVANLDEAINRETHVNVEADVLETVREVSHLHSELTRLEAAVIRPLSEYEAEPVYPNKPSELALFVRRAVSLGAEIALAPNLVEVSIKADGANEPGLRAIEGPLLELLKRSRFVNQVAGTRERLALALAKLDDEIAASGVGWEGAVSAFGAAVRAEAERRGRHHEVRTTLAQLPQLFIGG